jgi:hypothetical protein
MDMQEKSSSYITFDREVEGENRVFLVFNLTVKARKDVTRHFWKGEYTRFADSYKAWFSKTILPPHSFDTNKKHGVVHDNPKLRVMIARELGCPDSFIDEMDSVPKFKDEVYGHKDRKKIKKDKAYKLIEEAQAYLDSINKDKN